MARRDRMDRQRSVSGRRRLSGAIVALVASLAVVAACVPAPPTTFPATGRFSTEIHSDAQLTAVANVVYGTAEDVNGVTVPLALDLYLPPAGGPAARPAVILVHGGGFANGSRQQMDGTARSYARRGYVAATISYRLDPNSGDSLQTYMSAATDAIDDGMESVRHLRANAATHGIDASRIAMIGSSAGGAVALGAAIANDPTPGGPLGGVPSDVAAAVSTGATLSPGIGTPLLSFESSDAPSLMFHHEVDTVTAYTAGYSKLTCDGLNNAGSSCRWVQQPKPGHTVSLVAGGPWWANEIGPFLWNQLALEGLG